MSYYKRLWSLTQSWYEIRVFSHIHRGVRSIVQQTAIKTKSRLEIDFDHVIQRCKAVGGQGFGSLDEVTWRTVDYATKK
jgi:hypothetical protein